VFAMFLAWAPDVVQKQQPDDIGPLAPLLIGFVIVMIVVPLIWYARYELRRRRTGPGPDSPRRSTGGTAMGNALFELGGILDPTRPQIETIARLEEERLQDEAGDGRDPERARPRVRPKPEHPPAPVDKSGPVDARAFKPEGDRADGPQQRGHDHRAADPSSNALPPSVPRQ
jgi:hypothetical protein